MASIDVGGTSSRRALNRELTLVPFIDFLLCIIAFLLVTAVWSEMARLEAHAAVPGLPTIDAPDEPVPELHVDMRLPDRFVLEWRRGGTLLNQESVPRKPSEPHTPSRVEAELRLPYLATRVVGNWSQNGHHRAETDPLPDRAVLHASNSTEFEDIVAVMDAIHAVQRRFPSGKDAAALDVVFAAD